MGRAVKKPSYIEYLTFQELFDIKVAPNNSNIKGIPNLNYSNIRIYHEPSKSLVVPLLGSIMPLVFEPGEVLIIDEDQGELFILSEKEFHEEYDIVLDSSSK